MLTARDLTLRRGPEPLFERAEFSIFRGDKVGVTGANGSGKSSLFAALRGELAPDRGDIELPGGVRIAHVEQEIAAIDRAAIEYVLDGDTQLRAVMAAIEDAERRDAARAADASSHWRRELAQIEQRLAAIAAEQESIEVELCGSSGHRILEARKARLSRDAAALEARWMELGTALDEG
jgi:ATP-binding cassette subfamily F protein 3